MKMTMKKFYELLSTTERKWAFGPRLGAKGRGTLRLDGGATCPITSVANLNGGPIDGKTVLIFDDMISTAGSIVGAVKVAKENGAGDVYVSGTHAVLCGPAANRLREAPIKEIVVTNSLPPTPAQTLPNIKVISVAPLLGEAIRRIHRNESVSYLFD